jgi:hypothetical protein
MVDSGEECHNRLQVCDLQGTSIESLSCRWLEIFGEIVWAITDGAFPQRMILEFLGDSDPRHLKIVYYAGHRKLTNHGQPARTR